MPSPPVPPRRPTVLCHHGDERVDDWYWLRERSDPEVMAHLEAENAYTRAVLAPMEGLQHKLYEEYLSRIQQTDLSVPARKRSYWYYSRTVEGRQYPIHCRRAGSEEGPEEVLLDENLLAEGFDFFALGSRAVSPDHELLGYATDTTGGEVYTLRVRHLVIGQDLPDEIPGIYYGLAWASDNRTLFYTRPDDAMRPWQVWRHVLGTPVEDDACVVQEDDDHFYLDVHTTRDQRYVVITAASKVTSEVRVIPADDPFRPPAVVRPRRHGVEYSLDHHQSPSDGGRFLLVTNEGAENFRLMVLPGEGAGGEGAGGEGAGGEGAGGERPWRELVPHRVDVRLDSVDAFAGHLVLLERAEGLERIRVLPADVDDVGDERALHESHLVEMPEPVYSAALGANLEYDTSRLRFEYTSLVTPRSVFDYEMSTRERELKKQQPVLGDYDPSRYETARLWATAPDGARVPISVLRRRGLPRDSRSPALLTAYGSYEYSYDPVFSPLRLSLVDRGFVFAIAHVRGGGEMGRRWYEDGKLLAKKNTFADFVACAEHLVAEGYTAPKRLVARGGSAGGLLVGAAVNLRPDLFRAAVAEVPFVDVLTTILDDTLPLTVMEWEEWGNPRDDAEAYFYIKSYSPYDNIQAQDYPALLVTAGLHDPRVGYWEPAKWVARLRATKTDTHPVLLKTEMGAGHGGPSGRYDAWRDEALVQAFVLHSVGITE